MAEPARRYTYLIALGSNVRHPRHGLPQAVLSAALRKLGRKGVHVVQVAPAIRSAPLGPSLRQYANTAAIVETRLEPAALLDKLKKVERKFGRRPGGARWRARVLDLDIVLWSGGCYATRDLLVPHKLFRERDFVLGPAARIAAGWRDPVTGLTLRQLYARLTRRERLPRGPA
jgi:2-amino-4-hydroxy-6-hydroxymethyldihydropteridine diphosphokinase